MFGLMVLGAFVLHLVISLEVVNRAVGLARREAKSTKRWSFGGDDLLDGGDGADVLMGEGGNDVVLGDAGDYNLNGDSASTSAEKQGHDWIDGGDGNDMLIGGKGDDIIYGGERRDTYFYNVSDGIDEIYDDGTGDEASILEIGTGERGVIEASGESSVITLGFGLELNSLRAVHDGDDLLLEVRATGDTSWCWRALHALDSASRGGNAVESINDATWEIAA